MGGLLDRMSASNETETKVSEMDAEAAPPKLETTPEPKAKPVKEKDAQQTFVSTLSKPGLALGGLAFILTWFLGSYTLEDLTGPVPFGLVVLALFAGSFYLVWESAKREKTVVIAVCYLLLAAVPYGAGLLGGGFVGITDIDYSDEGDDLTFKIRGGFNSVDVSIRADGTEVWSGSGDLSNELKNFRVPVEDVFAGNGELHDGKPDVEYTIYAESSNGLTNEVEIPSKILTREAQNAGVRIAALQNSNNNDEYLGITVELLVGLINPNFSNNDGGGFQAVGLRPMSGDYTIDVTVSGGDTWSESTITVDENLATWASQSSGLGSASTDGWFGLTGTEEDNNGVLYLDKEDFYNDPGCYSFKVDIVNSVSSETTHSTTWSWDIDLESGNGEQSISKGIGIGDTC